jgi:cobalt-zinc-cadmium efflux system outer membrane protein
MSESIAPANGKLKVGVARGAGGSRAQVIPISLIGGILGVSVLITTVFSGGCSTVPKDAGFSSVRQTVGERTGQIVQWRSDTADDAAADTAVRQMLAQPITADQAVQVALLNNRGLQATFEDLGIAQADLVQAGLLRNPVFNLSVRIPDRRPAKTYIDFAVAEDFLDIFLIPARKRIAEAQFEQAKFHVTYEVLTLAIQTRTAYYQYQAAQQVLELRRTAAEAAAASLDAARQLHDAGNMTPVDYLSEEFQRARAQADLTSSEGETDETRERLNQLMGVWGSELAWSAPPRLAELPGNDPAEDGLEELAVSQRLDLSAAKQQELSEASALGLTEKTRFLSGAEIGPEAERETDGQWRIGPTILVPVPLFDQGQAAVARAFAQLRQSHRRYQELAADIRSQVRMSTQRLHNARLRVEYYRDHVLPIQQKLVHQTQLEYNAMLAGVFRLLQARRDQIEAGREYVTALRDYWVATAELEQAIGGRLRPDQSSMNQPSATEPSGRSNNAKP